ncbi:hypothetical protein, partial [Comamonas terrigena]|uniref:hypothetical protein n=1 Tax=Comamonas terrigena TaxID=32013 RepID=UPI0028A03F20
TMALPDALQSQPILEKLMQTRVRNLLAQPAAAAAPAARPWRSAVNRPPARPCAAARHLANSFQHRHGPHVQMHSCGCTHSLPSNEKHLEARMAGVRIDPES